MKLAVAFVFLCLWCSVKARCVMYGECAVVGGFEKLCPVDHEALPLIDNLLSDDEADEILQILAARCPFLVHDDDGNLKPLNEILTCCDGVQIRKLEESLMLAGGVLGRCPVCHRNFARQICEMICSPDQSTFTEVKVVETTADNIAFVNEVDYRLYEDFMVDAHASCSGVIVPQTGMPAINLMCGNAVVCDPDAWFGFTGDTSQNPLAPVQVNFLRWPTPEDSMSARAPPCNETLEGDLPCSCVDCIATCPVGNEPTLPDVCTVMSVDCIGFSVSIVFFVITVTIFVILTILDNKKMSKKEPTSESAPQNLNILTRLFQISFAKVGVFSASHPVLIFLLTSWLTFGLFFGVANLTITSEPLELWSAPESRSRQELNYFNSRFGPFYRAAQAFITINLEPFESSNITYGPAYRVEALTELVKLEDAIINIGRTNGGVTLEQICYAPNKPRNDPPNLDLCVTMSASSYLGDQRNDINNNTYMDNILNCLNNHYNFGCLASWGGGAEPEIAFGGYDEDIRTANTLILNFPIQNFLLEEDLQPVLEWEQSFINLLHDYEANWKADFVEVAFGTERSIEDEIDRISLAESITIAISYAIMFVYVIIALGNIRSCKTLFVDSKIIIAIGSFFVVLLSLFCALQVMGYFNATITLLAINVVPFFILSVGIDNVFLMVNTLQDIQSKLKEFDDYNENFSYTRKRNFVFEKMLGRMGPSMFVSSVTQITCFAIGSLANFPAVRTFAIFASISLGFLFVFQVTVIVALLSLDYKRAFQNRFDVLCCIQKKKVNDEDPLNADAPYKSIIQRLMDPYSKFILDWRVKICVAILFMGMASVSVILISHIEVGLDQELALPPDSYVYKYLLAVNELMHLGPPVYFVLKSGLNFTDIDHQNTICGSQLCHEDSLATQIFLASRHSEITYISRTSNSWLDDFFEWSGLFGSCCKYNTTDGGFCQSMDVSPECSYCVIDRDEWYNGLRPSPSAFEEYIPFFLQDEPTELCNKGGLASYSSGVNYLLDSEGRATVQDTHFMAYHTNLRNSFDYITAVKYGYEISENITNAIHKHTGLDVEVFPYSVFYVYYEQYLTIWADTFASIGYCILGTLLLNLLASGFSFTTTFTVIFTVILVVVNMMGVMYLWNIPLNAVSNINLIVSIGIAVEFCTHIAYSFNISKLPPRERVGDALRSVGATIITGITFTNIPIVVLRFSYTEVIEVFFFRMLFSIVVLGFLHGMIFYPVLLSYVSNLRTK